MEEELALFKQSTKKDQNSMNKQFASTINDIKNKTSAAARDLKESKKCRRESTNSMISMLEQARTKFEALTEGERKRRNEYDSIVLGLLDRTVDQGERLMRRIG